MEITKFSYSTKQEAVKAAGLDFVKCFYFRPDGEERSWSEYKKDEEWRIEVIGEALQKSKECRLLNIVVIYSDSNEVSAIFEFDGEIDDRTYDKLSEVLVNDEQYNDVMKVGVDHERIMFAESY